MVVKGLNHDLDASFLVLKPSACQHMRSAQGPRNALLARMWHLQLKRPSTRCRATALGVPTLYSWQCPHLTCLLCYTRFETMPGNKVGSLRVPTLNGFIVFYTLWEDAGRQSWVPGSAHIQLFYTIRGLMECKCMCLSAIIIGLYGRERS